MILHKNRQLKDLEGIDFIREKVRIRDNHQCQMCGKKWELGQRRFDVHHLDESMESRIKYSYDKKNMDKMITYCHKCHLNLDSVIKKMKTRQKKIKSMFHSQQWMIKKREKIGVVYPQLILA